MSGPRLAVTVRTTSPQGHTVILGPDDDLPAWAFDVIDHPRAWEGGVVPAKPEPAAEVEPAKPAAEVEPAKPAAEVEPAKPAAEVEPAKPAAEVEPAKPAAEVEPAKPAASASEADWRAYALANGKTETDLDGLGRNDIRDLFA